MRRILALLRETPSAMSESEWFWMAGRYRVKVGIELLTDVSVTLTVSLINYYDTEWLIEEGIYRRRNWFTVPEGEPMGEKRKHAR